MVVFMSRKVFINMFHLYTVRSPTPLSLPPSLVHVHKSGRSLGMTEGQCRIVLTKYLPYYHILPYCSSKHRHISRFPVNGG